MFSHGIYVEEGPFFCLYFVLWLIKCVTGQQIVAASQHYVIDVCSANFLYSSSTTSKQDNYPCNNDTNDHL